MIGGRLVRAVLRKQEESRPEALRLSAPVRVAIIGAGKAARFHARALTGINGATLACFVSRGSPEGAAQVQAHGHVPLYVGVEEALRRDRFDAAIVAVSWGATVSVAETLLRAGIPCLIEKPLGTTSAEALRLVEAGAGRTACVAYNLRFQSSVLRALEIVEAFGSPMSVHIDAPEQSILAKTLSGAESPDVARQWLLLNTTHALNLFQLFLGAPVRVMAASPARYFEGVRCDYAALLVAPRGGSGLFSSHWRSPGAWTLQAYGADYRLVANLRSNTLEVLAPGLTESRPASSRDTSFKPGVVLQDYYFLQSVLSGAPAHRNLATLESGLEALRLAEELECAGS